MCLDMPATHQNNRQTVRSGTISSQQLSEMGLANSCCCSSGWLLGDVRRETKGGLDVMTTIASDERGKETRKQHGRQQQADVALKRLLDFASAPDTPVLLLLLLPLVSVPIMTRT